jgi:DNA invertase Pin-like site-specific DNA recombinase
VANSRSLPAGYPPNPSPDQISLWTQAGRTVLPTNKRAPLNSPPVSEPQAVSPKVSVISGRQTGKRTDTPLAHIGYARVSTTDQDTALQLDALNAAGCSKVFEDHASGAQANRAGLREALAFIRDGDVLVTWKLDILRPRENPNIGWRVDPDLSGVLEVRSFRVLTWTEYRLGRSLPHLIETVAELGRRGVGFRSITEAIDTTTPSGRLVFHLFGALGQFERDLIQERTRAGLAAAAARGRKGGRKPVITADKLARARAIIVKGLTVREAATRLKVSKTALYEALAMPAAKNSSASQ